MAILMEYFLKQFLHFPQIDQMLDKNNPKLTGLEQFVVFSLFIVVILMMICLPMLDNARMEEQRNLARRRQLNSEKTFYFDIL
jgi:hypothetical protein